MRDQNIQYFPAPGIPGGDTEGREVLTGTGARAGTTARPSRPHLRQGATASTTGPPATTTRARHTRGRFPRPPGPNRSRGATTTTRGGPGTTPPNTNSAGADESAPQALRRRGAQIERTETHTAITTTRAHKPLHFQHDHQGSGMPREGGALAKGEARAATAFLTPRPMIFPIWNEAGLLPPPGAITAPGVYSDTTNLGGMASTRVHNNPPGIQHRRGLYLPR